MLEIEQSLKAVGVPEGAVADVVQRLPVLVELGVFGLTMAQLLALRTGNIINLTLPEGAYHTTLTVGGTPLCAGVLTHEEGRLAVVLTTFADQERGFVANHPSATGNNSEGPSIQLPVSG